MNLLQAIRQVFQELQGKAEENPSSSLPPQVSQQNAAPKQSLPQNLPSPQSALPPELVKLPVLPQVPPNVLNEELDENKDKIWRYLYRVLENAITNDLDEVYLWRIDGTLTVLYLKNNQYHGCLQGMKEFFMKTEEYEYIPFCNELETKLKINDVIRASR